MRWRRAGVWNGCSRVGVSGMSGQSTETPRAAQAWADYLALGPDRSLTRLAEQYQKHTESSPAVTLRQLKKWSTQHDWQGRLKAIADAQAREAEERQAEYIRSIMETGFGLPHERVALLKGLAATLQDELTRARGNRRWVKDVKGIGKGEDFERVVIKRFNRAEFETLRGLLDDIAAETGGRIKKQQTEISGPGGGAIAIREVIVHMPATGDADGDG
jgi:hypothetical protein